MVELTEVCDGKADLCTEVLDDLPEWFGIPDAKLAYIAAAAQFPMLAAYITGEPAGFVSLKRHTDFAVELYVLGVKQKFQRHGIGRRLIEAATAFALRQGALYLTVKTLAASKPDAHYAKTRAFYQAMGFVPIEEFPTLWDSRNPCLLMLKSIKS